MYYHTIVADPPWQYHNKIDMSDGVDRSAMSQYATMDLESIKWFLRGTPAQVIHPDQSGMDCSGLGALTWTMLEDLVADEAHLWLWVTNPFLIDGSAATIAKAWGFEPKTLVTWVKGRLEIEDADGTSRVQLRDYGAALGLINRHTMAAFKRMLDATFRARLVLNIGMGRYLRGCTEHLLFCTKGTAQHLIQDHGVPNVFLAPRGRHSEKPDAAFDLIQRASPGPYLSIFERAPRAGFDVIGDEL